MADAIRFACLIASTLFLTGCILIISRIFYVDFSKDPEIVTLSVIVLSIGALGTIVLVAVAAHLPLACVLTVASGVLLMFGGALLIETIVPQAATAAGPGAMALLFPLVLSVLGLPVGLVGHVVVRLLF